ncbi:hypothetical protein [Streptomyces cellostaticus]|uniref:hypothetical protein n=1 Tax=Streptomyces cellostaticus TaxID=67285 RepID=UPI0020267959|nr:hypothetical protein [Streptomyces cellostaticus]
MLVLLTGSAELLAARLVEERISDRLRARIGDNEVDLDGSALLALARGRLNAATVTGDSARLGRIDGATVDLRLTGLELGGSPHADRIRGSITVPPEAVARALQQSAPGLAVSGVRPDPSSGTLVITVQGGLGTLTVRPALSGGKVVLTLDDARIMGRPAPAGITSRIEEALRGQSARQTATALPLAELRVTSGGLVVVLSADDVALR